MWRYLTLRRQRKSWREVYIQQLNYPIAIDERGPAFTPEFLRASNSFSPLEVIDDALSHYKYRDPWDTVMAVDSSSYLHGLLVMEDKISMFHSLETRVPLLDNELIDMNLTLPWKYLCDGERGKIVYREAVRDWVPGDIYRKLKMGFAPPDASWYRCCVSRAGLISTSFDHDLPPSRCPQRVYIRG